MSKEVFSAQAFKEVETTSHETWSGKQVFDSADFKQIDSDDAGYQSDADPEILWQDTETTSWQAPSKMVRYLLWFLGLLLLSLGIHLVYHLVQAGYDVLSAFPQGHVFLSIADFIFYLVLAMAMFALVFLIYREYRSLRYLQKYEEEQRALGEMLSEVAQIHDKQDLSLVHHHGTLTFKSAEDAKNWCYETLDRMKISVHSPAVIDWKNAVNEYHQAMDVLQLFSQIVLEPFDQKVLKGVHERAATDAVVVAVSPYPLIDMLFVCWRNIRLMKWVTSQYGMNLGYIARIKLYRYALFNVAVVGVSESIDQFTDVSYLISHGILGKFSTKVMQGMGMGYLSARLGVKAMQFARPLPFTQKNKPSLSTLSQVLFQRIKTSLMKSEKHSE
ncbi:TIGR01620 family protein [Basilea psittacipulmonis]|uniref:TIGR01620 family protein n=1 Tax=Basilea psittacipulmonis DSM 24701 TaxID=1072685 RepID=A0A077DEE1_9BURK|nr:TIGR01620 family protein [Basilea psittacipulmonis]AIL32536.1 hypothetical protein IX83_03745 [Basilea psittacipulmonis DSM 24701]